jgi:hypothetical protein
MKSKTQIRVEILVKEILTIKEKSLIKGSFFTNRENEILDLIFAYGIGQSEKIARVIIKRGI